MADNYISRKEEKGSINISEEVVTNTVKSAVSEVEGFASFNTTAGAELAEILGIKTLPKGIKVQFADTKVIIDCIITISYGYNIIEVSKKVQENVRNTVASTIGFDDVEVNVHVSGIEF